MWTKTTLLIAIWGLHLGGCGRIPQQAIATSPPPAWQIDDTGHEVHFSFGGQPIASFSPSCNGRPAWTELRTLGGRTLTRQWPMRALGSGESADHPHHRGCWFGHGDVNGIDFWAYQDPVARSHNGAQIKQTDLRIDPHGGQSPTITTANDWIAPDGQRVCRDQRRFEWRVLASRVIIDAEITLIASDGEVRFGDTKEGSFAVRVAGPMKVDHGAGGRIENADRKIDGDAWGVASSWVDYSGPTAMTTNDDSSPPAAISNPPVNESSTAGITIIDHPENHPHVARWHVRQYGLFAANPFGRRGFEQGGFGQRGFGQRGFDGNRPVGGHVIAPEQTLTLRYRLVLHDGPLDRGDADRDADDFAAYLTR